ncbi:MAG TPA: choice-of-anchor tandem repeat GloVer-containing protein [Terriglobia bacterium]
MQSRILAGAAIALFVASMTVSGLAAQTFTNLFSFCPEKDCADGEAPSAALVQGSDGNFYGTSVGGGTYNQGNVFKITPGGTLTTLYSFCAESTCPDGTDPVTAMVLGTDGNFYGTTYFGGPNPDACPAGLGCGTIFKITPAGTLTTLYSFCAQSGCTDGSAPGPLVQGSDGNFYGTTARGGSLACESGCGTIFKITPTGVLTTLYSFNPRGGYSVYNSAGLVQATDGNFYGTTNAGGSGTNCGDGCGTVFRITPEGVVTTLRSFDFTDGAGPSGLIQAADGNLYGTTGGGGEVKPICGLGGEGCGTVFKVTLGGTFTTLAFFNSADGSSPTGLVQGTDGNFYGTGGAGGACNCGVVFEVSPEGVLGRLHSFAGYPADGRLPLAGLVQATNGIFYGTTFRGGGDDEGTIFGVSVGLAPFVKTVSTFGRAGSTITILGNNLKFATSVTFNGVAASFTVQSSTYIKATVPAGATTGPIVVTLPSGTLTSNVNFQVLLP